LSIALFFKDSFRALAKVSKKPTQKKLFSPQNFVESITLGQGCHIKYNKKVKFGYTQNQKSQIKVEVKMRLEADFKRSLISDIQLILILIV